MKLLLLLLLSGVGIYSQAQDLTGIWRGNFRKTPTVAQGKLLELMGADERYKFEVQIDHKNKSFTGVTYSYLTTVFYGKATARGTFEPRTKKVLLEELKIVEVRMAGSSGACIMTCFLQYSKDGDEEFLEGTYVSFSTRDSSNCGKGTVFLRKVPTSDFYEEPFLAKRKKEPTKTAPQKTEAPAIAKTTPKPAPKTTTPAQRPATAKPAAPKNDVAKNPPPVTKPKTEMKTVETDTAQKTGIKPPKLPDNIPVPKVLSTRHNELVQTITTSAKEVNISIYDNGTIDDDTVSVYLDKKLVLSKKRLTERPLKLKLNLDEGNDFHELVMVAENLGSIPPNTSLMVVEAGDKTYEVRITSNEKKNAVVNFRYSP
jgi:3-oxoacyl-[acyl-carrier protein] reductase